MRAFLWNVCLLSTKWYVYWNSSCCRVTQWERAFSYHTGPRSRCRSVPRPSTPVISPWPRGSRGNKQWWCWPELRLGIIQWHLSGGSSKPWRKGEKGGGFQGIPFWKKHESEEKGLNSGLQGGCQRFSWCGSRRNAWGRGQVLVLCGWRLPPQSMGRSGGWGLAKWLLGAAALGGCAAGGMVGGQAMSFVVTVRKTPFLMARMRWACWKCPKQKQPGKGRKGVRQRQIKSVMELSSLSQESKQTLCVLVHVYLCRCTHTHPLLCTQSHKFKGSLLFSLYSTRIQTAKKQ